MYELIKTKGSNIKEVIVNSDLRDNVIKHKNEDNIKTFMSCLRLLDICELNDDELRKCMVN